MIIPSLYKICFSSSSAMHTKKFLRFIPARVGQDIISAFSLMHEEGSPATPSRQKKRTPHGEIDFHRSKLTSTFFYVMT